jgi:hypothetical protein
MAATNTFLFFSFPLFSLHGMELGFHFSMALRHGALMRISYGIRNGNGNG